MSKRQISPWIGFPGAVLLGLGLWATASGWVGQLRNEAREANTQKDLVSRRRQIVSDFSALYIRSAGHWESSRFLGVGVWKNPLDLWILQEIIYETKPDVIIETGTFHGGSAHYMAKICDLVGRGKILSIDIEPYSNKPEHPRVQYLLGSSVSSEIVQQVKKAISPGDRVMVTLDSDHSTAHVLNELRAYSPLVTAGNYLIVEDTNSSEEYHPARSQMGGGPLEAAEVFLKENGDFRVDRTREKFVMTFNPKGYLLKTAAAGNNP